MPEFIHKVYNITSDSKKFHYNFSHQMHFNGLLNKLKCLDLFFMNNLFLIDIKYPLKYSKMQNVSIFLKLMYNRKLIREVLNKMFKVGAIS